MQERDKIIKFLKRELIGPDPMSPHIQENGEEILVNEPPRLRYGAAILFPKTSSISKIESIDPVETVTLDSIEEEIINTDDQGGESIESPKDIIEDFEEEIGLANSYLPSALGFSCFSRIPKEGYLITFSAARYENKNYTYTKKDGTEVNKKAYFRIPLDQVIFFSQHEIPTISGQSKEKFLVDKEKKNISLKLNIRNRTHPGSPKGLHLLTFTLINTNLANSESIKNEDCFFQITFSVSAKENCFLPYKITQHSDAHDDVNSNLLLFRNKKTFAVGHGCSPTWNDTDIECTNHIIAEVIPSYEVKPIVPAELKEINLNMFELSDLFLDDITFPLSKLASEYEEWIKKQEKIAKSELQQEFKEIAYKHIESCLSCLERIKNGINLIKTNKEVNRAFRLMNRSMLLQQLHSNIETREWITNKHSIIGLKDAIIPDIMNKTTWKNGLGVWRPFQIAFILMNLTSILDPNHKERAIVDLIWFPTGGGKTEAYLGLSAFTIFLKRLKDKNDSGTTVLMRYTLRLLTAQQFQRAATLICACDKIRKENETELGKDRITIGLWVGESLSPIYRADAKKIFSRMEDGKEESNPFIVLKCPWCGAQMGLIKGINNNRVKGYKLRSFNGKQTIIFQCDNSECYFSQINNSLPLIVIDEDIYDSPPTLLLGTVDKFAMITWRPEAKSIFGFRNNERLTPPELIIQDELHLISGPLGSMVGLYETLIEELCTANNFKPKIIASTATISRAREQINSLYGRGINNVNIFPPQCLNAGDSFFAFEDKKAQGRVYIGIFATALPSHATAQVRVLSALLQGVKSIEVSDELLRDPYWTLLSYFNSLRELGHAATLIRADIREYINSIWIRKGISGDERRFINKDIELTSRINSSDIPDYLEQLSKNWTGNKTDYPVDICLATNMISVGVDIQRLGLMTVIGQPKTTSEYIQATSRVGRSKKGPGLVFTVYNCSKPRDRSYYEHFQGYHSKIYTMVEPTSVTPFSSPARERALHAVLVGLIRFYSEHNRDYPKPFPSEEFVNKIKKIILTRVNLIDKDEYENTKLMINEKLQYWKIVLPSVYGSFGPITDVPLMYPAGSNPPEDIKLRAWPTPTSMRNVDSTCDGYIINNYINIDG